MDVVIDLGVFPVTGQGELRMILIECTESGSGGVPAGHPSMPIGICDSVPARDGS